MKIFLDANIILDMIDLDRGNAEKTREHLKTYIYNADELYTSCDIFTTVYYVASRKIEYQQLLDTLEKLLRFIAILPIDIDTITRAMHIGKTTHHKDLEDILQYLCARDHGCTRIITNDKSFYSPDIDVEGCR